MPRLLHRFVHLLTFCLAAAAWAIDSSPPIVSNQNHHPAGQLRDGVLTLALEIDRGIWHPEAEDGMAVSVYAFGETGHPLENPGPLIRVPQGTEIRASVHNRLPVPITMHGLAEPGSDVPLRVAPTATEQVRFHATSPGLYFYWGASDGEELNLRYGVDSELTGAFVVDPPGAAVEDEIFVIEMISEHPGFSSRQTLATINGKSWPFTQRFEYDIGKVAHWRWINATNEPHALHLHGFYFNVDAFNHAGHVESFSGDSRPFVVTQRIAQGETFDMSWSPDRSGQWLFHCHMFVHMIPPVVPKLPGIEVQDVRSATAHDSEHDKMGMGQLILGVTVPPAKTPRPAIAWHAERKLQVVVKERPENPRYAIEVRDLAQVDRAPAQPPLIGPPIVLTRGQPVEIEVLNRMSQPTAIHWHGIELESYYDGVPGWSGAGSQTTPPIGPGESFVAHLAPPRAGTFIYHTHWHDESQLTNGLYGPLIVLRPGETYDPASDLSFIFSIGNFGMARELALVNGSPEPKTLVLQAGKKYRFRLINISTNNQGMQVSLRGPSGLLDWSVIAKDGADLPASSVRDSKAQLIISVGETYDVEFMSAASQEIQLDLLRPAQKMHTLQTLVFQAPAAKN